jgi:hypothetical protein
MERIELPDTNVSDFSQARRAAVDKAGEVLARPVIVAWKDDNSGKSAPEIPRGKGDRWHDYGESRAHVLSTSRGINHEHWNHPPNRADPDPHRRDPSLAAQPGLGLRPPAAVSVCSSLS